MMAECLDVSDLLVEESVVEESVVAGDCSEEIVEETIEERDVDTSVELQKSPSSASKPSDKTEKLVQLPLSRIKSLIKLDSDVSLASQDAVLLIAKATELFIETLGREACKFTQQNKKKTIQRKDIDDCIDSIDVLTFLEGALDN